jgi:hypothetical protein
MERPSSSVEALCLRTATVHALLLLFGVNVFEGILISAVPIKIGDQAPLPSEHQQAAQAVILLDILMHFRGPNLRKQRQ